MEVDQAIKIILSKIECMNRKVSGVDYYCSRNDCDNCYLNYAQGTFGEHKEALLLATKYLKKGLKKGKNK